MADDPSTPVPPAQPDPAPATPEPSPAPAPSGPTAADVERARQEARAALLQELGVDKVDDVKSVLTAVKAAEDATKTQAQRDAEAAVRAKAEAEAERAEARKERQEGWVELELVTAGLLNGIPEDKADLRAGRLKREARALMVDLPADADREAVVAAVVQLKTEDPDLFGQEPPSPRVPPHQVGSRSGTTKGKSERERAQSGAERAKADLAAKGADQHVAASLISQSPWDTPSSNDPTASLRS